MDLVIALAFVLACLAFLSQQLGLPSLPTSALWMSAQLLFCIPPSNPILWRYSVALLQVLYACSVMYDNPKTRMHLTLWLNLLFGVSRASGLWVLHGAAFMAAHTLLFGYLILLHFAGKGSILTGFVVVDVNQLKDKSWAKAIERSFMLHFIGVLYAHIELHFCGAAKLYASATWGWPFVWSGVVSPLILPLTYERVQIWQYGSPDEAAWVNYSVPKDVSAKMTNVTKLMAVVVQLGCYYYLLKQGAMSVALVAVE